MWSHFSAQDVARLTALKLQRLYEQFPFLRQARIHWYSQRGRLEIYFSKRISVEDAVLLRCEAAVIMGAIELTLVIP